MYGAILGDIIGSPYEFNANNCKSKDFPLFSEQSSFTDDTVMTLAVAEAFLEGGDFEDVVRTAVSLGGDSDTIACIAGAIAEGFYGVPEALKQACRKRLAPDLLAILDRFQSKMSE